jgi:hypothetical protein
MYDERDYDDAFNRLFEWDERGVKRRRHMARDREHITMQMQDGGASGFRPLFADGSPDHTSPNKPGFRFADTCDASKKAADDEYEKMKRRMASGYKMGRTGAPLTLKGKRSRGGTHPVPGPSGYAGSGDASDGDLERRDRHDHDAGGEKSLAELQAIRDQALTDRNTRMVNGWRNDR